MYAFSSPIGRTFQTADAHFCPPPMQLVSSKTYDFLEVKQELEKIPFTSVDYEMYWDDNDFAADSLYISTRAGVYPPKQSVEPFFRIAESGSFSGASVFHFDLSNIAFANVGFCLDDTRRIRYLYYPASQICQDSLRKRYMRTCLLKNNAFQCQSDDSGKVLSRIIPDYYFFDVIPKDYLTAIGAFLRSPVSSAAKKLCKTFNILHEFRTVGQMFYLAFAERYSRHGNLSRSSRLFYASLCSLMYVRKDPTLFNMLITYSLSWIILDTCNSCFEKQIFAADGDSIMPYMYRLEEYRRDDTRPITLSSNGKFLLIIDDHDAVQRKRFLPFLGHAEHSGVELQTIYSGISIDVKRCLNDVAYATIKINAAHTVSMIGALQGVIHGVRSRKNGHGTEGLARWCQVNKIFSPDSTKAIQIISDLVFLSKNFSLISNLCENLVLSIVFRVIPDYFLNNLDIVNRELIIRNLMLPMPSCARRFIDVILIDGVYPSNLAKLRPITAMIGLYSKTI